MEVLQTEEKPKQAKKKKTLPDIATNNDKRQVMSCRSCRFVRTI